jgi:hypothetical protein
MVIETAAFRYPHYHSNADTSDKVDYAPLTRCKRGIAPGASVTHRFAVFFRELFRRAVQ